MNCVPNQMMVGESGSHDVVDRPARGVRCPNRLRAKGALKPLAIGWTVAR